MYKLQEVSWVLGGRGERRTWLDLGVREVRLSESQSDAQNLGLCGAGAQEPLKAYPEKLWQVWQGGKYFWNVSAYRSVDVSRRTQGQEEKALSSTCVLIHTPSCLHFSDSLFQTIGNPLPPSLSHLNMAWIVVVMLPVLQSGVARASVLWQTWPCCLLDEFHHEFFKFHNGWVWVLISITCTDSIWIDSYHHR